MGACIRGHRARQLGLYFYRATNEWGDHPSRGKSRENTPLLEKRDPFFASLKKKTKERGQIYLLFSLADKKPKY